jgi:hypothetical protein
MKKDSIQYLNNCGIKVIKGLHTEIVLTEQENQHAMAMIDVNNFNNNNVYLRNYYNTLAIKYGLPACPAGFKYTSGASRELNIVEILILGG